MQILFVCTGNICRSPLAEALLRHEIDHLPVVVSSAGTHALEGHLMTEQNQTIARTQGVLDTHRHSARQLNADIVRSADLVLALDRGHRRRIVNLVPRSSRYAFTLREFSRLTVSYLEQSAREFQEVATAAELRNAIRRVAELRGTLPLLDDPNEDDVVDPYLKEDVVYEQSAAQLIPAVSNVVKLLCTSDPMKGSGL